MKWLLDHMSNYGADVNQANKVGGAISYIDILHYHYNLQKGSTPLLIACEYQKTEMVKFLLDQSDEVTQQTEVHITLISLLLLAANYKNRMERVYYTLQLVTILLR